MTATKRSTRPSPGRQKLVRVTMGVLLGACFAGACNPITYYGQAKRSTGVTTVGVLRRARCGGRCARCAGWHRQRHAVWRMTGM